MLGAHWATFAVAAPLMALTPGANQLLSLRNALLQGPGDAVVALAGRFSAFLILVLATAAGLGGLLVSSEPLFAAVKWCGVAYLVFLGVRLIVQSRSSGGAPEQGGAPARRSLARLVRQEFVVAITNPKALLLFAAFLPQFADRSAGDVPAQLTALGCAYIAIEFVAALLYAGAGGALTSFELTARARRLLDRVTGVGMLAIAAGLASVRESTP